MKIITSAAAFILYSAVAQAMNVGSTTIEIVKGDITKQYIDVVVNAANPQLAQGGGICGALFKAAGVAQLQAACNQYPSHAGVRCPVGEARITPSFMLKPFNKNIIHAVGPDCRIVKNQQDQQRFLAGAYQSSLELADQNNLTGIAFPFISSGIYSCSKPFAAQVALEVTINYLSQHPKTQIKTVRFVLYNDKDYALFEQILSQAHLLHTTYPLTKKEPCPVVEPLPVKKLALKGKPIPKAAPTWTTPITPPITQTKILPVVIHQGITRRVPSGRLKTGAKTFYKK